MSMQKEINSLSFEDAMTELEAVIRQLETGKIPLDEAVSTYEYGVKLKEFCEKRLAKAKMKIDKLMLDKNGVITGTEPFADVE